MCDSAPTQLPVQSAISTVSDVPHISTSDVDKPSETDKESHKSVSIESADTENTHKLASMGSFKRRSIRRRSSRRQSRLEPEYGHDTETYEKIRERVLQERAVTNAIDALQERWRMIMYMYDDLVDLNEERRDRKLRKLCVKRQSELIILVGAFILVCLPLSIVFALLT